LDYKYEEDGVFAKGNGSSTAESLHGVVDNDEVSYEAQYVLLVNERKKAKKHNQLLHKNVTSHVVTNSTLYSQILVKFI